MSQVWELDLPRDEKIIALAFADHADDDGVCFPSVGRIAWKCGYSGRSVQRKVQGLIDLGILVVIGPVDGGRGIPVRYQVVPSAGTPLEPFVKKGDKLSRAKKDDADGGKGDTCDAGKGDTAASPESPVINRQEPSGTSTRVACAEDAAPEWMHEAWERILGNGHPAKLTSTRRGKYRAMFVEQLRDVPDPRTAFDLVLMAVKKNDHLMSDPAFYMPDSLFKGPDRRDTRVQQAVRLIEQAKKGVKAADDFAAAYRARKEARSNG